MGIPLGLSRADQFYKSDERSPGGAASAGFKHLRSSDGKGMIGCIIFLVLIGTVIFLAIRLVPLYYSNHNFKSDVETEVSRAASKSLKDEIMVDNILAMAKTYEIELSADDITVDRFAGQVHVEVNYTVPVNFALFQRGLKFHIAASSFVGTR
jgi:hypothetical protein